MQKLIRCPLPFVALLALAACAAGGAPAELVSADNVAIGERAMVDGPIVEPVAVIEDSRCPADVTCAWAGRIRVEMIWHRGNGAKQRFIAELDEPTPLADGQFTLDAVRPDRHSGREIAHADYRFSMRFAGGL